MNKWMLSILLCVFHYASHATTQVMDILIVDKDTFRIEPDLLRDYDFKFQEWNEKHGNGSASNCWRGYIAEWKIIDSTLYLSNLYYCNSKDDGLKNWVKEIIGKEFKDGLLNASWVTGEFWAKKGYVRELSNSIDKVWEDNLKMQFVDGKLIELQKYSPIYHHKTRGDEIYNCIYKGIWKKRLHYLAKKYISLNVTLLLDSVGNVTRYYLQSEDYYKPSTKRTLNKLAKKIECYTVYYRRDLPIYMLELKIPIVFYDE